MEKILTATGKSFDCDYFNPYAPANQVNISLLGMSLVDVASVFGNKSETEQLWYGGQYLSGYTKVIAIIPGEKTIRLVLGKE